MRPALLPACLTLATLAAAQPPRLSGVPFTQVRFTDAFWAPRLETNRTVTIPHNFKLCEETGRLDNFRVAGKQKAGEHKGYFFNDSDVFKLVEGACYALRTHPDPALRARVDELVAAIAAAQEQDGYLYTARTLQREGHMPPGGKERWSDLAWGHELYCAGHLYEAAIAHHAATGTRTLLDVALAHADLVARTFGPGKREHPDGHPEVELALARLADATGQPKYRDLARFFLEARGRPGNGRALQGEYAQDHLPVDQQRTAVGHAVRAAYLYAGMAEVDAERYLCTLNGLWQDIVTRKLYVTGGIGARGGGEAFGADFELPNRTAYAETCAAIANAFFHWRVFLATGNSMPLDVFERVLYNGLLSGVSLAGDRFFYPNPLESEHGAERVPWFDCACCPPNVVRFLAALPGYVYAQDGDSIHVCLYGNSTAELEVAGTKVRIEQTTAYPWDGRVQLEIRPERPLRFKLCLRVPGWAREHPVPGELYRFASPAAPEARVRVGSTWHGLRNGLRLGFHELEREWKPGDTIELDLPMPVRRIQAKPEVADCAGKVAIQRGPILYCAEGLDQPGGRVQSLLVPDAAQFSARLQKALLGGVVTLHATTAPGAQPLTLIPYYAWANRGRTPMAVWLQRVPLNMTGK